MKGSFLFEPSMVLEGHGRLFEAESSRTLIYVSQKVASDSTFPFEHGDKLNVRIEPDAQRLIIEPAPDQDKEES